ncbi:MAG TPA: hypothetical protein VMG08_12575 [Allosphingosinicella sp.]|nr:hypothetical protein [Allosphingosinicella sp.]
MLKLLLGLLLAMQAEPPIAPEPSRYFDGQVWEYHTRPGEERSLLKIQRIETYPGNPDGSDGKVYHISVVGVRLGGATAPMTLQHLPVSSRTLDASVTRLATWNADFPSAEEGIGAWRQARGGMFHIPMTEIIAAADAAMARQRARDAAGN